MNRTVLTFTAPALLLFLSLSACTTQQARTGPVNEQGLAAINHHSFEQLLIRPGAAFDQYRRVMFEPLKISYDARKRYDNLNRPNSDFQFDQGELDKFNRQFVKALSHQWQQRFGWEVTNQAADDVILVKTDISDLYLFASIKNDNVQPYLTFTDDSSTMIISLRLVDSRSGQLLLDSRGKKTTGWHGQLANSSSVRYWNDAYRAYRQWASLLGQQITGQRNTG